MAERQRTEIDAGLLARVRAVAEAQGRPESDVLEEAVVGYLSFLYARSEFVSRPERGSAHIGKPFEEIYAEPPSDPSTWRPRSSTELFALVDRWQREKETGPLSDDEAMKLAVEEQHAMRSERGAAR
jgi:hypothetical protein